MEFGARGDPRVVLAGADVFRLNFSHGSHADHGARLRIIRSVEKETGRPIGVLADLQGPKLRVGIFADGPVVLKPGQAFRLDLDGAPGDDRRVQLPHAEIFAALVPGAELLLDDGKLRLQVEECGAGFALTRVVVGGRLSDRKGVNVPGVVLPITALTDKDRADLAFALEMGADWIALSFVQRPEDVAQARALIGERASIVVKLEKPSAVEHLEEIVELADAVMVARGDLGVELPAERVPAIQKRIVRSCRTLGKPVIVPTRAEASDVATAIYDGADAVMLSAESASGRHPIAAVDMMDRIIAQVEADPQYRHLIDTSHIAPRASHDVAEAVCGAMRRAVALLHAAAIVCYTSSGHTSLRAARERPESPILSLTPSLATARRLALGWGIHSVHIPDVADVEEMTRCACDMARRDQFAQPGQIVVAIAGMPFGTRGTTNLLRVAVA